MRRTIFSAILFVSFLGCGPAHAAPDPIQVHDFSSCIQSGRPMLKTLPGRCIGPDGTTYTDTLVKMLPTEGAGDKICVDKCGDGICQEIVCLGSGCPCAESSKSCPKDCH